MNFQLKYALCFALAFLFLGNIAYSQGETDFRTIKAKNLGYSISFPKTWIKSDFRTTSSDRFVAIKNEGKQDVIGLSVAAEKFSEVKTTNDFIVFQLKHPETFTQSLTKPVLISIKRAKLGLYDAVRAEVVSTSPDNGSRETTIFYSTVVNDVSYGIFLYCETSKFPLYKSIMEKVADSFTVFPIEGGFRVRSPSDILNSEATSLPQPSYPAAAKAVGATGEVRIEVKIDENGSVFSATPISGHPLLRAAAVEAAKKARFETGYDLLLGILVYNFPPK